MATQQVPLQTLISEEPELALLTIQRRPVVDHLRMYLDLKNPHINLLHVPHDIVYLVYPLHVVPQLLQVLDVPITYFTDDKVALAPLSCPRLARLDGGGGGS